MQLGAGARIGDGAPPRTEGSTAVFGGEPSKTATGAAAQWEAVNKKLQDAGTSEARRGLEKEILGMFPKLEPAKIAELVVRVYAFEHLRSAEFLDDLSQALAPMIPKFGSTHLTRLTGTLSSWALVVSTSKNEERPTLSDDLRSFFAAVSTEVSLRLMDVAPGDLSRISSALAAVGLGGVRLFASLARAAVARSDRFQPNELVALVCAFDKARFFQTALFESLARNLRINIKAAQPRDVLKGMKALATCGVRDEELGQVIGETVPKKAQSGGRVDFLRSRPAPR